MNIDEEIDKIVNRAADDLATRMKRLVAKYMKVVVRETAAMARETTNTTATRAREPLSSSRKNSHAAVPEKPSRRQQASSSSASAVAPTGSGRRGKKIYSDSEFSSDSE